MLKDFSSAVRPALVLTALFAALLGLVYPLALTGVAQLLFPRQANGSLITGGGQVVGSDLVGQAFAGPGYFHGRPSAAGEGYDATSSGGSNLGPTSRVLAERVSADVSALDMKTPLPADMVTASGSGLDPHISPENATLQVSRVAVARGLRENAVAGLVASHTEHPLLGFIGEPRVNVLALNRALDSIASTGAQAAP